MSMLNRDCAKYIGRTFKSLRIHKSAAQASSLSQVDAPKDTPPEPAAPSTPGEIVVGCQVPYGVPEDAGSIRKCQASLNPLVTSGHVSVINHS